MNKMVKVLSFSTLLCSFSGYTADPNKLLQNITAIRADWQQDIGQTVYYYQFDKMECGTKWIKSGDENVNKVLMLAYSLKMPVDVGILTCEVITTVRIVRPDQLP